MSKKLTASAIDAIRPPARGQIEIRDGGCPGLILRVSQGGSKTWSVRYLKDGKRHRYDLGRYPEMGLADAHKAAKAQIGDVAKGENPAAQRAAAKTEPTFAEVADEYITRYAVNKRKRGLQADQGMLRNDLLPAWGDWKISQIQRRHIIALLDKILDRNAPMMANRVKTLIAKIFNWAENRATITYNPAVRLSNPAPKHSRERVLSEDEIRRLFEALATESPRRQAVVRIALLTAARRGEILGMRWAEIDGEWWTLPKERTKNNREHRIFLVPSIMAALSELPRDGEFVFHSHLSRKAISHHGTTTLVSKWFGPLLARAGIEAAVFHDLRRTAATHMNRIGIDSILVERLLNHVQQGVAAIYNRHGYDKEKRVALLRWERELDNIINGGGKTAAKVVALHA